MKKIIQSGMTQSQGKIKRKKPLGVFAGAEAEIILSENFVIKNRVKKSYRVPELDEKIRKLRTRSEAKLLEKAAKIINSPKPLENKELFKIKMPFIKGGKLSENLGGFDLKKQKEICRKIGESVAKLHDEGIIHGDLTTSNMIYVSGNELDLVKNLSREKRRESKSKKENFKVFLIDFGLGFISRKTEDKAVDLHLFKQAVEAKHFKYWKEIFQEFIGGYKISKDSGKVLEQFKKVEQRGRYKEKY